MGGTTTAASSSITPPTSSTSTSSSSSTSTKKAAVGTLATILLRVVSFVCTQCTLRSIDPAILGRANIQLELLLTTVLFISREGFRLALTRQRTTTTDNDDGGGQQPNGNTTMTPTIINDQQWNNVAWLSVPVTAIISLIAATWHVLVLCSRKGNTSNTSEEEKELYDYKWAGILYCAACAVEGSGEPACLLVLRQMRVPIKATAEAVAITVKTMATVVLLQYLSESNPITAFGLAQLAYATSYTLFLYGKTWPEIRRPSYTGRASLDWATCYMTLIFTLQGLFKHVLTEGDRIVLTTIASTIGAYNQGIYAMGASYGSMAARILLQPLEENARLLWSRLSASINNDNKTMDEKTTATSLSSLETLQQSYTVLVKLVLYIGFLFSCFAVNYTSILLNILAGTKWGSNMEAIHVLSWFCVYTAFLAWNGMTEAFVYSVVSSGTDIGKLSLMHGAVAMLFACLAPLSIQWHGTTGLVQTNCLMMTIRAFYSTYYAALYFATKKNPTDGQQQQQKASSIWSVWSQLLHDMFPHPMVLLAFAASYYATSISLSVFDSQIRVSTDGPDSAVRVGSKLWIRYALQHIGVGVACLIGSASIAYFVETQFRQSLRKLWHGKQD